ncbi:hypothetical protein BZA77DRAFT_106753 [Pyronema omphalodes]|nr:hypothetical protein BZA77DRAFT_106753 [Pyronema omphalodes]
METWSLGALELRKKKQKQKTIRQTLVFFFCQLHFFHRMFRYHHTYKLGIIMDQKFFLFFPPILSFAIVYCVVWNYISTTLDLQRMYFLRDVIIDLYTESRHGGLKDRQIDRLTD